MDKRTKTLVLIAIFLFVTLLVKSVWIDPVMDLEGDLLEFKILAEEHAPIKHNNLLYRTGLITYRVTKLERITDGELQEACETCKSCSDAEGEKNVIEEHDKNRWKARVRAYFIYIIPFRDITVKESDIICNHQ
ncbi:MAG: hypothetical protein ACLKAK_00545 [Alkaliphilus sp.]